MGDAAIARCLKHLHATLPLFRAASRCPHTEINHVHIYRSRTCKPAILFLTIASQQCMRRLAKQLP